MFESLAFDCVILIYIMIKGDSYYLKLLSTIFYTRTSEGSLLFNFAWSRNLI